jgi:hypothetical protein
MPHREWQGKCYFCPTTLWISHLNLINFWETRNGWLLANPNPMDIMLDNWRVISLVKRRQSIAQEIVSNFEMWHFHYLETLSTFGWGLVKATKFGFHFDCKVCTFPLSRCSSIFCNKRSLDHCVKNNFSALVEADSYCCFCFKKRPRVSISKLLNYSRGYNRNLFSGGF